MLNNIKSFGYNVIPDRQKTIEKTAESIENAINSMIDPLLLYLQDNENVFSGAVEREIEKINSQTMRLGMTMSAGIPKRNINYES